MRSKQINFFLTAKDQSSLLEHFRSRGDFEIACSITYGCSVDLLETAEVREMGVEWLKVYLVRPNDLDGVRLNYLPNQNYKTVDIVRSLAIEFDRCYHAGQQLRRGRLYFVTAYYDGGVLV